MTWWQWVLGLAEFVGAWYVTAWLIGYTKRPPKIWKQPTSRAVHPNDWPTKQCAHCHQNVTAASYREDEGWLCIPCGKKAKDDHNATLNIPDDWRQTMERKELRWREGWIDNTLQVMVAAAALGAGIWGMRR
jgi:hypothetical protein